MSSKNMKGLLLAVLLILAASALGLGYFGYFQSKSDSSFVENVELVDEGYVTYMNTEYGVAFQYPPEVSKKFRESVSDDSLIASFSHTYEALPERAMGAQPYLNTVTFGLEASTKPKIVEGCLVADSVISSQEITDVATTTINDVPFLSFKKTARNGYESYVYAYLHEGTCYSVVVDLQRSGFVMQLPPVERQKAEQTNAIWLSKFLKTVQSVGVPH